MSKLIEFTPAELEGYALGLLDPGENCRFLLSQMAIKLMAGLEAKTICSEPETLKSELLKRAESLAEEAREFADTLKCYPVHSMPDLNFDLASGTDTTIVTHFVAPPGWKLVPKNPTARQWAAGLKAMQEGTDKVTLGYRAMVDTAPAPVLALGGDDATQ